MKKTKDQILNVLMIMLVGVFAISCNNTQQNENQGHGNMIDDAQTEMMEGEDHMHEDGQSDEQMMNDTTSMNLKEEMD